MYLLTEEEETLLEHYFICSLRYGFPLIASRNKVKKLIRELLKTDGRDEQVGPNGPSTTFFQRFSRRHPDIENKAAACDDDENYLSHTDTVVVHHLLSLLGQKKPKMDAEKTFDGRREVWKSSSDEETEEEFEDEEEPSDNKNNKKMPGGCLDVVMTTSVLEACQSLPSGQSLQLTGSSCTEVTGLDPVQIRAEKETTFLTLKLKASSMGNVFQSKLSAHWKCEITSVSSPDDENSVEQTMIQETPQMNIVQECQDSMMCEEAAPGGDVVESADEDSFAYFDNCCMPYGDLDKPADEPDSPETDDTHVDETVRVVAGEDAHVDETVRVVAGEDAHVDETARVVAGEDAHVDETVRVVAGEDAHVDETVRVVAGKDAPSFRDTDCSEVKWDNLPNVSVSSNIQNDAGFTNETTMSTEDPCICSNKIAYSPATQLGKQAEQTREEPRKKHVCPTCGKGYLFRSRLLRHAQIHYGVKRQKKKSKVKQITMISTEDPSVCSNRIADSQATRLTEEHAVVPNPDRQQAEPTQEEPPKKHVCPTCGKEYPFLSRLLTHVQIHYGVKRQKKKNKAKQIPNELAGEITGQSYGPSGGTADCSTKSVKKFCCEHCGVTFTVPMKFRNHVAGHRRKANNIGMEKPEKKRYSCEICGEEEPSRAALMRHFKVHTGPIKLAVCSICSKGFATKQSCVLHMRVHTGEKPFVCSFCGKGFTQKNDMLDHQNTHTDDRPYRCNICGSSFRGSKALRTHKVVHSDDRKFACTQCDKKFKTSGGRNVHMQLHASKLTCKHYCTMCEKGYRSKRSLEQHQRSHSGERPFICPTCGKTFVSKSHLNRHIHNIHTGEKPYQCLKCGERFELSGFLKKHMLLHGSSGHSLS